MSSGRLVFVLIRFPEGIDKYAEKFELQQIRVKQSYAHISFENFALI